MGSVIQSSVGTGDARRRAGLSANFWAGVFAMESRLEFLDEAGKVAYSLPEVNKTGQK
jgi:hypothetical protein